MFSLKVNRCAKVIKFSFVVLISITAQSLFSQVPGPPSTEDKAGIIVHYGTSTPGVRHELPSNQELGVDINRFIGNPAKSHPYVSHDAIFMRSILRHGDPLRPGEPGAILEYRKELAVGVLTPA